MMLSPLARPSTKFFTLEVVRLYTATVKPLDSMFITRFSPMTARPIRPISAFIVSLLLYILYSLSRTGGRFQRLTRALPLHTAHTCSSSAGCA